MADAVYWKILEIVQDGLRTNLSFVCQEGDSTPDITAENIVIRKLKSPRMGEPAQTTEEMPGILVCVENRVSRPPEAGTNEDDDAMYMVACQIIAKDSNDKVNNLKTYLKWQEQVARYLNHYFASNQVIEDTYCIYDSWAIQVDVLDDKRWVQHQNFVSGVVLTVAAREGRGVTE